MLWECCCSNGSYTLFHPLLCLLLLPPHPLFLSSLHYPLTTLIPQPSEEHATVIYKPAVCLVGMDSFGLHQPPWSYSPVHLQTERCRLQKVISALLSAHLCWSVKRKSNVKILQSTIFHPFSIPEDYVLVQWLSKVGLWVCPLWSLVSYFIIEAIRKQYPAAAESDKRLILALIQSNQQENLKETFHLFFVFVSSERLKFSGQLRTSNLEFSCFHQPF